MSIIMGALGGAGAAMQDMGSKMMASDMALDNETKLAGVRSDLELKRQQTLEEFKNTLATNTANQQREAQSTRINAAVGGIVNGKMADKYASSDAAVAAAANGVPAAEAAGQGESVQAALTPEQKAAIDQSKAADRQKLMDDPYTRTQAAIQTGDISPKDAMNNASKLDINQLKMDNMLARADDKNATAKEIADIRADAMKAGYELRLQAAQEKNATGKIDTATGRMLITSEDVNIKAATSQIGTLNRELVSLDAQVKAPDGKSRIPNPAIASIKEQMDSLRADIKASQANKATYLKSMGLMSDGPTKGETPTAGSPDVAPQPGMTGAFVGDPAEVQAGITAMKDPQERANAQSAFDAQMRGTGGKLPSSMPVGQPLPTLPAGAVQIGTSGGKPVYRTPDGKKFIAQ